MDPTPEPTERDTLFLPDFCEVRVVFVVIVIGQLLAFILVLTPVSASGNRWTDLAMTSLFIQWVALSSLMLLCLGRRWLGLLDNIAAGVVSYIAVLTVTLVLSEAAYWLVKQRVLDVSMHAFLQGQAQEYWFTQSGADGRDEGRHIGFLMRNLAISAIVSALAFRYFYVQFQWRSNLESETQARIQALQSRIRPHFLFNSMNTIASFTRTKPALAEQVVEDLADLFRVSLGDARVPIMLSREVEVCREYLRIEQLRLGERLTVEWSLNAVPDNALIPALSLQPLLENAVYHGIEPAPDGGTIEIVAESYGKQIAITVSNTISVGATPSREGNQMAQENVRQRLQAFFGGAGTLRVSELDGRYNVCIAFPYQWERS